MPVRRSHTKSRHGCLQCKRRKVKVCFVPVQIINRFRSGFTVSQKRLKHLRPEEYASASNLLQCDESLPACQRCLQRHELCSFSERSPNSSIPTYEVPVGSPYTIKPDAVAKQPLKGIAVS